MNDIVLHTIRSVGSVVFEVASGGDYKAKLPQKKDEYITTWNCNIQQARRRIRSLGYRYQPLAARKSLEGYGKDDGSFAKVDPDDKTKQYHVHLYEVDANRVKVFSHWEYRVIHPFKHYTAEEYVMGKTCDELV